MQNRKNNRRKNRLFRFYIALFVLLSLAGIIFFFVFKPHTDSKTTQVITHPTERPNSPQTPTPTSFPPNSPGLTDAISTALSGTHGSYGIVIENLSTGESYYQNATVSYKSGSLYKLWVMGEIYQEVQDNKIRLSDTLTKDLHSLYKEFNFQPDGTEPTDGTISLAISDALYQMITISSNNAALLLTDNITVAQLQQYLQKNHLRHSIVGLTNQPPLTAPIDIATFFEKLYKKELPHANDMLALLKQQKLNDKLPKYLPDNIDIAHKTGELDNVTHDAGIVYGPSGDYIIVVLSQSDSPDLAKERIALVSQAVYNYFTGPSTSGSQDDSAQPIAQPTDTFTPTPAE